MVHPGDGLLVKARVDYAARDVQMIYSVSIPDPERKVVLIGSSFGQFFGMGGGWDFYWKNSWFLWHWRSVWSKHW